MFAYKLFIFDLKFQKSFIKNYRNGYRYINFLTFGYESFDN